MIGKDDPCLGRIDGAAIALTAAIYLHITGKKVSRGAIEWAVSKAFDEFDEEIYIDEYEDDLELIGLMVAERAVYKLLGRKAKKKRNEVRSFVNSLEEMMMALVRHGP